jgi:hypothetical protein
VAITATDIKFRFTVNTSPGLSTAGTANDSLGGYASSTEITSATLHNLFDVVTGEENAASDTEFRAIYVHNAHATLTWESVRVWISSETAGGTTAAIALDGTGVTTATSGTTQVERVANENTAPTGETFSLAGAVNSYANGLVVGNVAAGSGFGLWIRRAAGNTAAQDLDGVVISVQGDTAA